MLVVLIAVLFSFVFSPDRLLLFPSQEELSAIGAAAHTIPFQDGKLEIWTGRSRHPGPSGTPPEFYLLRFYGNADRADPNIGIEASEWSIPHPVEIWGVNYPGYGGSTGPATLKSIGPAALAAYDALRQKAGDRPIIVFGTSIGSTAALHVAVNRPIAGLVLQNPPPLRQIALRQFGWWNLWLIAGPLAWRIPAALDSVSNARACRAPCAFLLAQEDEIVRPKYQSLVAEAYAGDKRLIRVAGAHHNDPLDRAAVAELDAAYEWMLGQPRQTR